ncbi:MAG: type II secretion system F family protein [Gammaproteobacteria bacterium]|nr:type II secretion system F family protein [Gammaproteobacteria bacterium]
MPMFQYQGRDPSGAPIKKILKASSVDEVVMYLEKRNITPIKIDEIELGTDATATIENFLGINNITTEEIMNFCRQLSTLIAAGVPIIKALNQLAQSTTSHRFSQALSNIADSVAAGQTFSDALAKYPAIFSTIVTNLIEVGENTGHLNETLMQISMYLEKYLANRRRLISTARYPIMVFFGTLVAMVVMNMFVIPKFTMIFSRFHLELPLATRVIIDISNFMLNHWLALLIAALSIIFGVPRLMSIFPILRYYWDKYKLRIPVTGNIQKRIIISQFCWTFALILRSGIPVVQGIQLAGNSTGNAYFTKQINKMKEGIEHGQSFSQGAMNTDLFFPTIIQMIEVGEETGRLDEILTEVSQFYDGEIEFDIRRLNELLEPVLLCMVGSVILVMAIGIYFPMWDLIKIAQF